MNIEDLLQNAASEVNPTDAQRRAAARSHSYLRDILNTGQFERRIVDSFLSGSYSRDTAVRPLDDVDIIFLVDPSAWNIPLLSSLPGPATVLASFARAIRYRYESSSVHVQRRSVCLVMNHLAIDAVPAVRTKDPDVLQIPDVSTGDWIITAPKRHSTLASTINRRNNGLFKPVVKLLKAWNHQLPQTARTKSFAIETMAARFFGAVGVTSYTQGVLNFFDFIAAQRGQADNPWPNNYGVRLNAWTPRVDDLASTGSNVVAKLTPERRDRFIELAIRAREHLKRAIAIRSWAATERLVRKALLLP